MDDIALTKMWLEFKYEGSATAKEALILHYAGLVRHIVARVLSSLPHHIEAEELLGYATLGLLEAMERYDPERGIRFATFASLRIKGAIYDGLRANDWVSRFTRSRIRNMEQTYAMLSQQLGREPEDDEMCTAMDITQAEYHKLQMHASTAVVFSLDETFEYDDGETLTRSSSIEDPSAAIDANLMREDEKDTLVKAIESLPERERHLISMYYYDGLTLKEAGSLLGVTESRASQIHAKAILRLRAALAAAAANG